MFGKTIDWSYVAEKFIRDTVTILIAMAVLQQFIDGAGTFDPGAIGIAPSGAAGTAVYRLARELGLFGESA